jgi:hypothetical protein
VFISEYELTFYSQSEEVQAKQQAQRHQIKVIDPE